jgi:hypothetical protein
MKKKKINLLLPLSKCCLKKFYDLDIISKYGSITVVSILILYQLFNIINESNIKMSIFSLVVNTMFLAIILTKLEILKIYLFEKKLDLLLKIIFFIFILNFFGYLISKEELHNYFLLPLSFLGSYFIILLILK